MQISSPCSSACGTTTCTLTTHEFLPTAPGGGSNNPTRETDPGCFLDILGLSSSPQRAVILQLRGLWLAEFRYDPEDVLP